MKTIELNERTISKAEIELMDLTELNNLMAEVQEEIHSVAIEKQRLTTLPKSRKDGRSIVKVRKLTERIMNLQDCVNCISNAKKLKRDSQSKERDWLKCFYQITQCSIRKGLFEKIESEVTTQLGYGRL